MKGTRPCRNGFSLVEVVLALGVVSFALLAIVALLPAGIKNNKISTEETRATCLLTTLEADLRNTHPLANSGKSQLFGLLLPYKWDSSTSRVSLNSALSVNSITTSTSVGITETQSAVAYSSTNPRPRYQATVIYTQVPSASSAAPVLARLIVSWPAMTTTSVSQLTSSTNVLGFVETCVAFPAP